MKQLGHDMGIWDNVGRLGGEWAHLPMILVSHGDTTEFRLPNMPLMVGLVPMCVRRSWRLRRVLVFNSGQRPAVEGAFSLAGFSGPLVKAPVTSEDERAFLLEP